MNSYVLVPYYSNGVGVPLNVYSSLEIAEGRREKYMTSNKYEEIDILVYEVDSRKVVEGK